MVLCHIGIALSMVTTACIMAFYDQSHWGWLMFGGIVFWGCAMNGTDRPCVYSKSSDKNDLE